MYITFYIFSKILFPGFILHPTLLASLTHSIQHLSNTHLASSYIPLFLLRLYDSPAANGALGTAHPMDIDKFMVYRDDYMNISVLV